MDLRNAKLHLEVLRDPYKEASREEALDFLEKFIDEVQDYKDRSVAWSVEDFEQQAHDEEVWKRVGNEPTIPLYDRSKFEDALYSMIQGHDATLGITWDTISVYLGLMCELEED